MPNTEITDFEYPDIAQTDYIDESLNKILARDDASRKGFRRVETFPNVSASDVGMKVWIAGVGNFQLLSVDPVPQWKQLTDDSRDPAYMDWVRDNFQPLSNLLSAFSRLSVASRAIPYFNGPNDIQATSLSQLGINLVASDNPEVAKSLLEIGTVASLSLPLDGSNLKAGTVSKDKLGKDVARSLGWTTGDIKITMKSVADDGWVMMNDGSIGNINSGATTRANADTYNLFNLLWNIPACTIQTNTGNETVKTTALQDWTSNKRLVLPKTMGRSLAMAGQGEGLTAKALGSSIGRESNIIVGVDCLQLGDGTLIQWGGMPVTYTGDYTVTFEIPFDDDKYTIVKNYGSKKDTTLIDKEGSFYNLTSTGATTRCHADDTTHFQWLAIGRKEL